jgi:hypothetical protein
LRETFGESIPAAFFIIGFLSGGDSFKMAHQIGAAGHHAGSDTANREGREKLLGAAAADAQERLESGAVDPRLGAVFELAEGFGEPVEPQRFVWHFVIVTLHNYCESCRMRETDSRNS